MKNSKLSILTENWLPWYLRGADSESRLRYLKFWHPISVLGKFWPKKLKSVLSENWHIWCLKKADFYFIISFLKFRPQNQFLAKFGPKSQSCPFGLKVDTHCISRMLILIPTLVFWISNEKTMFGQIWARKVKIIHFGWKLAHMVSRGCWLLFQHFFPEFQTKIHILAKFGGKKSKLFILPKNLHPWYLEDADSYSKTNFLNFKT